MYVRVKRGHQTTFLYTDNSEKISDMKAKYGKIHERAANDIRFIHDGAILEDDKSVMDSKLDNDHIVIAVYRKGGDEWEEQSITKTAKEEKKD